MKTVTPNSILEDQLFQLFNSSSKKGLTLLYGRLSKSIHHYATWVVRDEFIASSIVQEAFLKAWTFRDRMTSFDHIRRFLKLTVRWECMAYYRNSKSKFYRSLIRLDWLENTSLLETITDQDEPEHQSKYINELLHLIPSIPNERQRSMMDLHFREGLSAKEISLRLQLPVRTINEEIGSACDYLRSLLNPQTPTPRVKQSRSSAIPDSLTTEQRDIYSMRYNLRYSFLQISELLKLPQPYVQQQYVQAHAALKTM